MDCEAPCCARNECSECHVAVKSLVRGVCGPCLEAMAAVAYQAPRGPMPERLKLRRERRSRAEDEQDISFYFNCLDGASGLHAASLSGRTSATVDPHEQLTNKQVLESLARGRRVEGRLRQLPSLLQRVIERVFSEALQSGRNTPFPRLTTSFGSLAGVVDLLGGGAGMDDRDLRMKPTDMYILHWEVRATDAIERAMTAYARAQ
jgi:hypothetical protein